MISELLREVERRFACRSRRVVFSLLVSEGLHGVGFDVVVILTAGDTPSLTV